MRSTALSIDNYFQGLTEGNTVILGRAITLIESRRAEDQQLAAELIQRILPRTGHSIRIGISGVPGVGKSTFIEAFGKHTTSMGKKIAVLAIDPSSAKTKGSILGDKTRMEELAKDPLAFIRPSSSGQHLGGVAGKTRESMLLCEAAGFEVILIETVGVGQSETAVRDMTDFFLLLMLAGAGDELQGIKKGIIEMADAIVMNKADGDNLLRVKKAQAELQHALHYLAMPDSQWPLTVLSCSALQKTGIPEIWDTITKYEQHTRASGFFTRNRISQNQIWMNDCLENLVQQTLQEEELKKHRAELEQRVAQQTLHPPVAAQLLFEKWKENIRKEQ